MSGIYDNSMFDSGEAPDITTNANITSTDGNNTEAPTISGVYPQVDNGNTIILYTTRPGGNDNGNDSGNSDDNNTGGGTGGGEYTDPDAPSTDTGSTTEYPGVTIIPTITLNAPSSNRTETFTNNSTIEISASGVNCSAIKAYVNGMLVCTAYGNSLSYTYPVNADGEYTVFVYGISSDDVWVASERYTVTFEAANIEGYFKIRNSAGKYLTYVTPVKNRDPISVADENNSDTQIWKIEASTETNKYHIKSALRNSHAVNIYRYGNYPCTMYEVAGNVADTSFTLESAQSNNYTIKWNDETDTRYLTCNGSGTYWTQTVNPQVWSFVPASYTPPAPSGYICYSNKPNRPGTEWMNCTGTRSLDNLIFKNNVSDEFKNKSFLYALSGHGCFITSIAILLKNLGATTSNKYDYRTDTSNVTLESDPYTVGMANLFKNDSVKWHSTSSNQIMNSDTTGSPFLVNPGNITEAFGYSFQKGSTKDIVNPIEKAQYIHNKIMGHPEGVIIEFAAPHYIVVTKSSFTQNTSDIDSCFTVCDPVNGGERAFKETWIARDKGYHISDVLSVYVVS